MKVLDLFSGIGGFSLGLERAGFETVAFCEIEPFPRKVLAKYWPDVPIYEDVRNVTAERLRADGIGRIDIVTGGFPCQDLSVAAPIAEGFKRGKGLDGERSGLWGECARIIRDFRPEFAVFENVTNLLNGERGAWFKRVLWDIYKIGYDAEWHCIPAANVGLPHIRDRIIIIAYPREKGLQGLFKSYPITIQGSKDQTQSFNSINRYNNMGISCIPENIRMDDGVSNRVDRAKGLGNAVCPDIPYLIGQAIIEITQYTQKPEGMKLEVMNGLND